MQVPLREVNPKKHPPWRRCRRQGGRIDGRRKGIGLASVRLEHVYRRFGDVAVVNDVSMEILDK